MGGWIAVVDLTWLGRLLSGYLLGMAGGIALGAAAAALSPRIAARASPRWRPVVAAAFAVVVAAATWLWTRAVWPTPPGVAACMIAIAAAGLGAGLVVAARRGRRTLAVVVAMLAAALAAASTSLVVGGRAMLSENPLEFEPRLFTTDHEQGLADRLRQSRPAPDEPRILRLTGAELNGLVNALLLKAGGHHKAGISLMPEDSTVQLSLAGPASWPRRFVNIEATGEGRVDGGRLLLNLRELRVGDRRIPWPFDRLIGSVIAEAARCEPRVGKLLEAVAEANVRPDELEVRFDAGKVGQDIAASLMQIVWQRPDIAAESRIYTDHLLDAADRTPPASDRLTAMTQAAFQLAANRSAVGDPRLENRAAIVALAVLLGHTGLEPLVGDVLTDTTRERAGRVVGTAVLQGRADWPRHFLVSAALKLLSNTTTSDSIGVFKEQIDAQDGGSGFSFADMLANMAGVRFAEAATATESGARAVQERLAAGVDFADLVPEATDLPDGLSIDAFEAEYGGVDGAAYQRMIEELERRLDALPTLDLH